MSPGSLSESAIFKAAVQLQPDQRPAYLDQACGENRSLREEVESLLLAHDPRGTFLRAPAPALTIDRPITERPGTIIGAYKLREQIGEGGFGVVYVAEQEKPVRRKVALKIIKPGMDTKDVIARFEAERQALALMDHPNVARVLDAGATDHGRPYFVMELVQGVTITEFCDKNSLPTRERLLLFADVCRAVQHAHQKGIIHRDLKPSNIMVTLHDGKPVAKVIDFGVSKALSQQLTEKSIYTAYGQMIGTPSYMSPEQAEMSGLGIDTRSDIYSLGVLLYELLTGKTPLDAKRLRSSAYAEILRIIREEEPQRPSLKISTLGAEATVIAQHRHTDPKHLRRELTGELDWIVMKCLEKDRARRYETANALARDIERHLHDEPVEACPPSVAYRLRKFARRNIRALTTAAVLGVALLVAFGAVGGSIGWTVRDHEVRRTKLAGQLDLILDEVKQQEMEQKWPEALAAARRAEALLAGGGGDADLNRQVQEVLADLKLVERLEEIRMEQSAHMDNLFEWAEEAFGAAFLEIGVDVNRMSAEEAAQRLQVHKQVAPVVAVSLDQWGVWRLLSGNDAGAGALSALAGRIDPNPWRQRMRFDSQVEIKFKDGSNRLMGGLDPTSVEFLERMAASPDLAGQPATSFYNLGMALSQGGGKHEIGTAVLRKAYQQYPGDFWINSGLFWSMAKLGPEYRDEALSFGRAALALRPKVGWSWMRMGEFYQTNFKRLDEANAYYSKAIELEPKSAWIHNGVAWNLWKQNRPDEAIVRYRKAIELDPKLGAAHSNLGNILREQKKLDESIASHRTAVEANPKRAHSHHGLGMALLDQFVVTADEKTLEEAFAAYRKACKLDPKNVTFVLALGRALNRQGKRDEAIAHYKKAIELNPRDSEAHNSIGHVLRGQGKLDEAIVYYRKAIELDPSYPSPHYNLGLSFFAQKKLDEAIASYKKAIELDPNNAPSYHKPHYHLGVALESQDKLAEAIHWFRRAVELDPKHTAAQERIDAIREIQQRTQPTTSAPQVP